MSGRIDTPGEYRSMLQDPMREKIMTRINTDMQLFDYDKSPFAKQAMIMCQVCLLYLYAYKRSYNEIIIGFHDCFLNLLAP